MQLNLWSGGPTLTLAGYWQWGNVLPDDPADTQAFGYRFDDGTTGSVMTHAYPAEYAMPLDENALIDGLLDAPAVVGGQAGLIEVNVERTANGVPYVYSLMKIKQEPSGVQYNLTLHLHADHIQQVQGFFVEGDTTGVRDATVHEIARQNQWLREPTTDDQTGGWARDPYTGLSSGLVMNMSELPDFDGQFPTHPLSMAREVVAAVRASWIVEARRSISTAIGSRKNMDVAALDMSDKPGKATHRRALVFSEIEELRRKGLNQTEIANMHGVSRQAVSQQKIKYGGVKTTRQIVNEAWPWKTTGLHGKSAAYQRLRDHGEFIASGGREMSDYKLRRHAAWLKMMRANDFVLEFDPNIPPTAGVAPTGGFAYRKRDLQIDGLDLLIRVNEFTNLTPEGRRLWSYAPGTSPHEIGLDGG